MKPVLAAFVGSSSLVAALTFPVSPPPQSSPAPQTSVQVYTDMHATLVGAAARLDNGTVQEVLVADSSGQSPWVELDTTQGVELVLAEQSVSSGVAIGLIEHLTTPPAVPGFDQLFTVISRTQPVATPVGVQGSPTETVNHYPQDGADVHWSLTVPQGSGLRFTAHVASLMNSESIDQFLEYRGFSPAQPQNYIRGADLVMPATQLGDTGMLVGVSLLGDVPGNVRADVINFGAPNSHIVAGASLGSEVLMIEGDMAYVRVWGAVRRGHLAVLVRGDSGLPSQTIQTTDSPPEITIPPQGGTESVVQDCIPDTPTPPAGFTCDPTAPSASPFCSAPTSAAAKQCTTTVSSMPVICRSAGSTFSSTTARTASWSFTFEFGAEGSAGSVDLSSLGGYTYGKKSEKVTTDGYTFPPGDHGLGMCMQYFRFELACAKPYLKDVWKVHWTLEPWVEPCADTKVVFKECESSYESQNECSRTP